MATILWLVRHCILMWRLPPYAKLQQKSLNRGTLLASTNVVVAMVMKVAVVIINMMTTMNAVAEKVIKMTMNAAVEKTTSTDSEIRK